jgi:hypothetical protein
MVCSSSSTLQIVDLRLQVINVNSTDDLRNGKPNLLGVVFFAKYKSTPREVVSGVTN